MKNLNIKKVLIDQKKQIIVIGGIFTIILTIFFGLDIYRDKKLIEMKLEENKELIFFNQESIKTKDSIETINSQIEFLYKELDATKTYDECINVQLDRLASNKPVDLEYCMKFNIVIEEIKKEPVLEKAVIKYESQEEIEINKQIYFLCKEVGANDPARCATYGTLVYNYESGHGTSRRCMEDNNCYGIKNPTDKNGLKGKYQIWSWNHLIFETKEMGGYAFAYYYSNYHINRNPSQFVNRWAGWNNEKYINYINQNYDSLYNKYKNFLTFAN